MPISIDDRMPLVLIAEMAAHIGAELRACDGALVLTFPEEPNALQNMIEKHHSRRAQRQRKRLEPLAIEDLE
jgi:hypothetical protein